MKTFLNWLDHRTGYRSLVNDLLYEPIPGGARWRYVWGSTLSFTFVVQLITGTFLAMAYSPSQLSAWESVYYIQHEMAYGWLVRGIHHYAAQAMMVLLALHFLQVIIDGAYKAPREVNFWLGLILLQVVLGLSLTGYLLPWDQKGYYATQVATRIVGVTPVVGQQAQELLQGGKEYGHHTLTRFYALHAGILPATLMGFLALHVYVFRRHGITVPAGEENRPTSPFWPDQVLKDIIACLAVLATILSFAIFRGAELTAPASSEPFPAARPEWYFLFLFQFLKFEAVESMGLAFGALYVPGIVMFLIAIMPLVGQWKLGHRFNVALVFALLIGVVALTSMAIHSDRNDEDFQANWTQAERDARRAVSLMKEKGIPPNGAAKLLAEDPLTQGPRIFGHNCKACHRYQGHDGLERKVTQIEIVDHRRIRKEEPARAPDLGNFGTREWLKAVITDYDTVFQHLKDSENKVAAQKIIAGEMSAWVKENRDVLLKPENAESLNALVEFIVSQSTRPDVTPFDEKLVAKGREIFSKGTLASGSLSVSCADCHAMEGVSGSAGVNAPTLTGYGGVDWLKRFIVNPGHEDFYGDNNFMPKYDKFSDEQLDLISRWLAGEFRREENELNRSTHHHSHESTSPKN